MSETSLNMKFKSSLLAQSRIKQLLTILTLTLFLQTAYSQLNSNRFLISGRFSGGLIQKDFYSTYGLSGEYIIKNKFGLVYNIDGISSKNGFRLHSPIGLATGGILFYTGVKSLSDKDTEWYAKFGVIGGLILMAMPDGISYHQNIGYRWDISPYANLLGIEMTFDDNHDLDVVNYACSFGVKTSYLIKDNLFCSGYLETRKTGDYPWSLGIGGGFGFSIKHKEEATPNEINKNQKK